MKFIFKVSVLTLFLIVIFYTLNEFREAYTDLITSISDHFENIKGLVPNQHIIDASKNFCIRLISLMVTLILVLVLLAIVLLLIGILMIKC